jgi:rhodanese-related sulfurtransferase
VYSSRSVRIGLNRAGTTGVVAAAVLVTSGCHGQSMERVTVGQLATQLKSADPPHLYDTNGDSTRQEYGVIPGATLLDSARSYSLELLPQVRSTKLVFYCASTWCGAAETAAERASRAGYTAVAVLPEGIKGWKEAGLPTEAPN